MRRDAQDAYRAQYLAVKRWYPDALALFRQGATVAVFREDAPAVRREGGATLTVRRGARGDGAATLTFPGAVMDDVIARLTAAGYRVALVEQVERADP